MQIWPAIDIRGGQCVRLSQGDYNRETVYGTSPAEMAEFWASKGAKRLHLVDLDGAKDGTTANFDAVCKVVEKMSPLGVACELGGGVRSEETIRRLLDVGLTRLVVGTLALKRPEWFAEMCEKFPNRLVLGVDARGGMVATDGWLETSSTRAVDLAKRFDGLPIAALVYTDVATDGMMRGPNIPETVAMANAVSIPIVASGGVTKMDDVRRICEAKIPACIIGRALYEKTIELEDALKFENE
ncbi:MAG: 1-(5-phosphoribosyl)-5-[(5-phosphoribosylamino)methylideneamino]imidazole-4-carboxamide isomerase [Thermoguttaceae bacterium]|nr:1-(5-phosphoribosyl)-5-[(5-phosphoribosylamino)methylideneamino]imidazole-4-carboxamide isomerase [Thermoguttaceae bacterium]